MQGVAGILGNLRDNFDHLSSLKTELDCEYELQVPNLLHPSYTATRARENVDSPRCGAYGLLVLRSIRRGRAVGRLADRPGHDTNTVVAKDWLFFCCRKLCYEVLGIAVETVQRIGKDLWELPL